MFNQKDSAIVDIKHGENLVVVKPVNLYGCILEIRINWTFCEFKKML